MGTNYYYYDRGPCPHCNAKAEPLHIGKSSCGWCFALHVYPDDKSKPQNLDDWKILFQSGGYIENEYSDRLDYDEMLCVITNRQWNRKQSDGFRPFDYISNHAEPGPNGLARRKIEPGHCIEHGDGTWDLIIGEFS